MVEPAFPLLGVLRVPARFMIFALLFASIFAGLALKRLLPDGGKGKAIAVGIILLLLLERWPQSDGFVFDPSIPEFYSGLAKDNSAHAIFFYPGINYYSALQEDYFQTIHGKNLSYGVLSRQPIGGNPLFSLYSAGIEPSSSGKAVSLARNLGYDYLVVEKKACTSDCFYDAFAPLNATYLAGLDAELEKQAGKPVFEDGRMMVYGLKR
jgi:hypothetical protein